jgi:ankyrin repeat protein
VDEARSAYAKDGAGEALHWLAKDGRGDAVRLLLELGADPSARDAGGATALHFAAVRGFREIAELLIDSGADLDVRDSEHGMAPHMWANAFGEPELVDLLLTRGARINLQEAARMGQEPIVEGILTAFPAAIDVRRGWATPLIGAVSEGKVDVVRMLLDRGADPSLPSEDGRTPLQGAAIPHGEAQAEIMTLLRSKGAR